MHFEHRLVEIIIMARQQKRRSLELLPIVAESIVWAPVRYHTVPVRTVVTFYIRTVAMAVRYSTLLVVPTGMNMIYRTGI